MKQEACSRSGYWLANVWQRTLVLSTLSCDHRVVDGWDAANFMQALKSLIENPLKLLSMR